MSTFNDCQFGDANIDIIKNYCLKNDPKNIDDCGYSALRAAVCAGQMDSVKYLIKEMSIDSNCDPNPFYILVDWYDSRSYYGGVDDQLRNKQIEIVNYLLEKGFIFDDSTLHIDDDLMREFLSTIKVNVKPTLKE